MSYMGEQHKLWQSDKTLWAILLFMKYTHKIKRWEGVRQAIKDILTEQEGEALRKCWELAKKEGRI